MIEPDQLLGRLRALCTKLDAPVLPNDLEEGQEILRYTLLHSKKMFFYSVAAGLATRAVHHTRCVCSADVLEEGQEILRYT